MRRPPPVPPLLPFGAGREASAVRRGECFSVPGIAVVGRSAEFRRARNGETHLASGKVRACGVLPTARARELPEVDQRRRAPRPRESVPTPVLLLYRRCSGQRGCAFASDVRDSHDKRREVARGSSTWM